MNGRASAAILSFICLSGIYSPYPSQAQPRQSIAREYRIPGISAKDGQSIRLYAYEKFTAGADPDALAAQGRIILVLHGATTSGRVNYDVQVAGVPFEQGFSLMDQFARRGYDVWTVDYQNYGRSDKHDCGLCVTTEVAARDVEAAVRFITTLRKVAQVHIIGWSWGGQVAGVFTEHNARFVNRLVLYAPPTEAVGGIQVTEHFRINSAAALIRIFHPTARVPAATDSWLRAALEIDGRSPNGVLIDLTRNPMKFTPERIMIPTLLIYGAEDLLAPPTGMTAHLLFRTLATAEKKFVMVPDAGHGFYMERARGRWYQEVLLHLELGNLPPRLAIFATP